MPEPDMDCLVIGGGPAGLTAAIYLARFHLKVMVVDAGNSRALWIPCTRNHAGFPEGISGEELIERMKAQACRYGAKIETEGVPRRKRGEGGVGAPGGSASPAARAVLLAPGTGTRPPPM